MQAATGTIAPRVRKNRPFSLRLLYMIFHHRARILEQIEQNLTASIIIGAQRERFNRGGEPELFGLFAASRTDYQAPQPPRDYNQWHGFHPL
jgi:hypothetical protein